MAEGEEEEEIKHERYQGYMSGTFTTSGYPVWLPPGEEGVQKFVFLSLHRDSLLKATAIHDNVKFFKVCKRFPSLALDININLVSSDSPLNL